MNSPFFQTLSRLFQFTENVKCGRISLELISWGPDSSLERARKIRRRLFTFSINREIRLFHLWCTFKVVLLIKPIVFLPFSLPSPSSLLKLPIIYCATTNSTESGEKNWSSLRLLPMKFCRSTLFEASRALFIKNWKIYSRKTSMFLTVKAVL